MALRSIFFAAFFARLVLVFAWTCTPATAGSGPDKDKEELEKGKELFTREWIAGDRRSHAGDGLGPVYNAQSCAACHRLGGIGGAGNNETNVSLVTVFVSEKFEGMALSGILPEHPLPPGDARKKI